MWTDGTTSPVMLIYETGTITPMEMIYILNTANNYKTELHNLQKTIRL